MFCWHGDDVPNMYRQDKWIWQLTVFVPDLYLDSETKELT